MIITFPGVLQSASQSVQLPGELLRQRINFHFLNVHRKPNHRYLNKYEVHSELSENIHKLNENIYDV